MCCIDGRDDEEHAEYVAAPLVFGHPASGRLCLPGTRDLAILNRTRPSLLASYLRIAERELEAGGLN